MENKTYGKTITIYLIDGTPNGRMTAEIAGRTGKSYKIPRTMVASCDDRPDLQEKSVYLLFGKDPEDNNKDMVYIGETEETYNRLRSHLANTKKDFWNHAVVILSKDDYLNKAHLKYLEAKMYERAAQVGRYIVANNNKPKCSAISEPDVAVMEEFFDNMALLISTLGYKVFDEIIQPSPTVDAKMDSIFYIKAARGAAARGQLTPEGFVVFKGSKVAKDEVASFKEPKFQGTFNLRQTLIKDDVIKQEENELIFSRDYLFSSPSTAAMVVMGRSANGRQEWKTADGKELKEIEQESLGDSHGSNQ